MKALDVIANKCRCNFVSIADSNGSLYGQQVEMLSKLFQEKLPNHVGFYGSNAQCMAYANTIQAICTLEGAVMVNSSILGLGCSAGITPTENLLLFLSLRFTRFRPRPILVVIKSHVQQLVDDLKWGPSMAHLCSGAWNMDPEAANRFTGNRFNGTAYIDSIGVWCHTCWCGTVEGGAR